MHTYIQNIIFGLITYCFCNYMQPISRQTAILTVEFLRLKTRTPSITPISPTSVIDGGN